MDFEIVSEEDIHKAMDWLQKSANECAKDKATLDYLNAYTKPCKALLMKKFSHLPISAQTREAEAHEDYIKHIESVKIASEKHYKNQFFRETALAKIEIWRTQNANFRAMKI